MNYGIEMALGFRCGYTMIIKQRKTTMKERKLIDVYKISDKQKLTIRNGINCYNYIMKHFNPSDDDFRDVFTEYYLKSQANMKNSEQRNQFFDVMEKCEPNTCLIEIVRKLKEQPIGMYEFSFATKLLHTVNAINDVETPIYDSKVRKYLHEVYEKSFRFNTNSGTEKEQSIVHDWETLTEWYAEFKKTPDCSAWIKWFNTEFPDARWINDIKKIDFIIFACN